MVEPNRNEKILVVDDEQGTLNMLRLLLGAYGYRVLIADSGEKALELFGREAPPIVMTDIRMPGMDGIEVLHRLKQMDPDVEVIVITGHGDMEIAIRALQHEASDFINKPIQRPALEVALQRAEERIALKRQLRSYTQNLEERVEGATSELAKSCRQLKTLCEISQLVGEMPSLAGIVDLLKERIRSITSFHCHGLMLLNAQRSALIKDHQGPKSLRVTPELTVMVKDLDEPRLFSNQQMRTIFALEPTSETEKLMLFPIIGKGEPTAGVALIGIPPEGTDEELHLVSFLLSLSAGAIRRSIVQEEELKALRQMAETRERFGDIIGKHETMTRIYQLITNIADSEATVLIQGESGTGKELVARRIHELSSRRDGPFVVINCSAYPQTLLESELFGHEKGAFTGAIHPRKGSFELAHGGTIFLDEIGEISLEAQVKLLRVIQFKEFQRLGSESTFKLDVRIIAATSRNLRREIEQGNFREDLYYRLHVIPITMPPLRERASDLPLLVKHFLQKFSEASAKKVLDITPEAMSVLLNHQWPGNVRELENVIEHAFILARGKSIEVRELPSYLQEIHLPRAGGEALDELEKNHLIRVLKQCGGNKIQAAKRLKISRSTLYRKLELYGLGEGS